MKKPFVEMKEETKKQFSEAGQQMKDALEKGRRECEKMFGIKDSESNSK